METNFKKFIEKNKKKHKVFISYHHKNDQDYKNCLVKMNKIHEIFIDESVDTGDISNELSDEAIRKKIRDEYLRDSTVTILLIGTKTKGRKHVDWELYSSMYDGAVNRKSGILAIILPSIPKTDIKKYLPKRITDNIEGIEITHWDCIKNKPENLRVLIDKTFKKRSSVEYDLSSPMRRNNS